MCVSERASAARTFYFMTCKSRVNKIYSRAHLDGVSYLFLRLATFAASISPIWLMRSPPAATHNTMHIRQRSYTKRRAPQHTQITIAAKIMRELYSENSSSFGYARTSKLTQRPESKQRAFKKQVQKLITRSGAMCSWNSRDGRNSRLKSAKQN